MAALFTIETDRFQALGSDGVTYTVIETTDFFNPNTGDPDDGASPVPRPQRYRVASDFAMVIRKDGALTIVGSGVCLARI